MAVRSTMADLIARVRSEIGDPTGSGQTFADQDVQDALDLHRIDVFGVRLIAIPTYPAGVTSWRDYHAPRGFWEADESLQDASFATISPTAYTPDRLGGHWTFTASQQPPVKITDKCYDIHGAAADLLEAWSAKEKLYHSFAGDQGEDQAPSQRAASLAALALVQKRRARPPGVRIVRHESAW